MTQYLVDSIVADEWQRFRRRQTTHVRFPASKRDTLAKVGPGDVILTYVQKCGFVAAWRVTDQVADTPPAFTSETPTVAIPVTPIAWRDLTKAIHVSDPVLKAVPALHDVNGKVLGFRIQSSGTRWPQGGVEMVELLLGAGHDSGQPHLSGGGTQAASPPAAVASPVVAALAHGHAGVEVQIRPDGTITLTCAYPAVAATLLARQSPPLDLAGDGPGVYVLIGKSARAVHLASVLTVEMGTWAYVGLSVDFPARRKSHLKEKPAWDRVLVIRSAGLSFTAADVAAIERAVYDQLHGCEAVQLEQVRPAGADKMGGPSDAGLIDAVTGTVVSLLRVVGALPL